MPDAPVLHHELVAEGGGGDVRNVVFLHGIYGTGRNWSSVARRVVRERPDWRGVMVHLRGHGRSPVGPPPHTVEAAARDLIRTARVDDFEADVVVGHSFGGKVALDLVRLAAAGDAPLPRQVWIVDSTPGTGEPEGGAWAMLRRLRDHPGPFRDRDEGVAALVDDGLAGPVARWMATNLEEGIDGAWRWRLDPDVMEALLRDFFRRDLWEVVESPPAGVELRFLRATEASVLGGESLSRLRRAAEGSPRVHLEDVRGGHWLNADNPDALVELLVDGLP